MEIFYIAAVERGLPDAANRHTFEVCRRLSKMGHSLHLFIPGQGKSGNSRPGDLKIVSVSVPNGLRSIETQPGILRRVFGSWMELACRRMWDRVVERIERVIK